MFTKDKSLVTKFLINVRLERTGGTPTPKPIKGPAKPTGIKPGTTLYTNCCGWYYGNCFEINANLAGH